MAHDFARGEGRALKILVADDHDEFRHSLVKYLRSLKDVEVVAEVHDGVQAVRMTRQARPDIVLMNIRLPKLDSWTAAMAIKAANPDAQVIALSLVDSSAGERLGRETAFQSFLRPNQIHVELPRVIEKLHARRILRGANSREPKK